MFLNINSPIVQLSPGWVNAICIAIPWIATHPTAGRFFSKSPQPIKIFLLSPFTLTTIAISVVAISLKLFAIIDNKSMATLILPVCQVMLVRIGYMKFYRIMDRLPENVAFNWGNGLVLDRILMMAIVSIGCILPGMLLRDF